MNCTFGALKRSHLTTVLILNFSNAYSSVTNVGTLIHSVELYGLILNDHEVQKIFLTSKAGAVMALRINMQLVIYYSKNI